MATMLDDRPVATPPPGEEGAGGTPPAEVPPPAAPRRAGPTFNQFVLAQLPLSLAVVLIFGVITIVAIRNIPAGGLGGSTAGAAAPVANAGGDAPITAFSGETVAQQVLVSADPTGALKWDRATYEAKAGDVTFVVSNKSASPHNFAVEGNNVMAQSKNFGSNSTNIFTLKGLKPGEYLIVCNFPGHRAGGMVAKLIVR